MNEVKVKRRRNKRSTAVILDFRDQFGQRHRQVVGRASSETELSALEREALVRAKRIELEIEDATFKPKCGEKSIDGALVEFWEFLQEANVRDSTRQAYHESIRKFRRFLEGTEARRLKDITPQLVRRYVKWQDGLSANTINGEIVRLQRLLERCVNNGDLHANPCKDAEVKSVVPAAQRHERAFTEKEVDVLVHTVRYAYRSPDAEAYADFFTLLSETGLRLGEGRMLRWCDVHPDDQRPYLSVKARPGWKPKTTKSERHVPLTPGVVDMLRRRMKGVENITDLVFPERWTNRSVNQTFNRCLTRAKLDVLNDRGEKLTVHSLRHYYATRLVRSGADPATVRDLLGHSSIVITDRYFNVPREGLFQASRMAFSESAVNEPQKVFFDHQKNVPKNVPDSSGFEPFSAEIRG